MEGVESQEEMQKRRIEKNPGEDKKERKIKLNLKKRGNKQGK
jgi:hypothetical protein